MTNSKSIFRASDMNAGISAGIRRLRPEDAAALVALRREALETQPLAFGSSIPEDRNLSIETVRDALANEEEQAVFGYFSESSLAGMVGVRREPRAKQRHKAHIWGMYVAPRARTQGVGRGLLDAAIGKAMAWPGIEQVQLSVTDAADSAKRMYEAAGFQPWGREPRSIQWQGCFVDETHLVLELKR